MHGDKGQTKERKFEFLSNLTHLVPESVMETFSVVLTLHSVMKSFNKSTLYMNGWIGSRDRKTRVFVITKRRRGLPA